MEWAACTYVHGHSELYVGFTMTVYVRTYSQRTCNLCWVRACFQSRKKKPITGLFLIRTYIFSYCWTSSPNEIETRKTVGDALRRLTKLYNNSNECINAMDNHIVCVLIRTHTENSAVSSSFFLIQCNHALAKSCHTYLSSLRLSHVGTSLHSAQIPNATALKILNCTRHDFAKFRYVRSDWTRSDWTRSPHVKERKVCKTGARHAGRTSVPMSSRTSVWIRKYGYHVENIQYG